MTPTGDQPAVNTSHVRPIPDVTGNAGFTIRAVLSGHPAEPGLLQSWYVAAERADGREWVTWEAIALDGERAGQLGYSTGHYFSDPDPDDNKRRALAHLAARAGG